MAVNVIDTLKPKNAGTFPIAEATDVKGGFMQVADNTERDAIAAARRVAGLRVHVIATRIVYELAADLTTWIGPSSSPVFKNALAPQGNSGTTAYPSSSAYAIASRNTFVRNAAADNDSVRMWSSSDTGYPSSAVGLDGQVTNLTDYIVDFYPVAGGTISVNGQALEQDEAFEIAPGSTAFWCVDSSGVVHITT